jgi:FMN-dependent NADH-azoreductase
MATLLHIQASPTKDRSYSLRAATAFVKAYREAHPDDVVRTLDVFDGAGPEFGGAQAAAKYKVMHGKPHTKDEAEAWAAVVRTIEDFKAADKVVISSAMWNFGIPYMLKRYIDVITQPGLTFSFTPAEGYRGLVTGKPALLILARGGAYPPGTPGAAYDFQKPYLEAVLRFIGFTQIESILVEPTMAGGPDKAAQVLNQAVADARDKARYF